jgi:hypothetical protein
MRILYEKRTYGYELMETIEKRSFGCYRIEHLNAIEVNGVRGLLVSEWKQAEKSEPVCRILSMR